MKRSTTKSLIGGMILLAFALGFAVWRASVPVHDERVSVSAPAAESGGRAAPSAAVLESPAPVAAGPAEPAPAAKRLALATVDDSELADAIWIEGRVTFPPGTPLGETVEVVAR